MLLKLLVLLSVSLCAECVMYSPFWAPLYDPKILNYRVDVPFKPDAAQLARQQFTKEYGYRGEKLIANLGNGRGPGNSQTVADKIYGEVKWNYT